MSYPLGRSHTPLRIQEPSASAAERARADRKFQPEAARPQPLLVEAGPAFRAATALQSGVDAVARPRDQPPARPKEHSAVTLVTLDSEHQIPALRALMESLDQALQAPTAPLSQPFSSTTGATAKTSEPAQKLLRLLGEALGQARRETSLRLMTQDQRIEPWVQCMRLQKSRDVDPRATDVYEFCSGATLASDVISLMVEVELRDHGTGLHPGAADQRLFFAKAVFLDALTQIFRITPDANKLDFIREMLRLMESGEWARFQGYYAGVFSLLGASEGQPNMEARPAYEREVRKIMFDAECPDQGFPLREIAVLAYFNAWSALHASDPIGIIADPIPSTDSFNLRFRTFDLPKIKVDMALLDRLWRDYPVPQDQPARAIALRLRSAAYWKFSPTFLDPTRRRNSEGRLLKLLVKPFGEWPSEAAPPPVHDRNVAKLLGLSGLVHHIASTDGDGRWASAVCRMLHARLPPPGQPVLRAQILELRGFVIVDLMESDWTRPLVPYMAQPLPLGEAERADSLALRAAVWSVMSHRETERCRTELVTSRGAYDLTFSGLPAAERRLLRNNLCDNLYKHDKRALLVALLAEVQRLFASGAEVDPQYCADLIHIDGLGKILPAQTLDWIIECLLIENCKIADAETRADQIVDLARATRAGLDPKNFERLRDALLKIDGLRPASVADSKAARAPSSPLSLDEGLNGAGSPAALLRRAVTILDLYAQVYAGDDDPLDPRLTTAKFFDQQIAYFYCAQGFGFTELDKEMIMNNLEGLRASYMTVDPSSEESASLK